MEVMLAGPLSVATLVPPSKSTLAPAHREVVIERHGVALADLERAAESVGQRPVNH